MSFTKVIPYRDERQVNNAEPTIRLYKNGMGALSEPAFRNLHAPKRVMLLADKPNKAIAILPAGENEPETFKMMNGWKDNTGLISMRGALRAIGIEKKDQDMVVGLYTLEPIHIPAFQRSGFVLEPLINNRWKIV